MQGTSVGFASTGGRGTGGWLIRVEFTIGFMGTEVGGRPTVLDVTTYT